MGVSKLLGAHARAALQSLRLWPWSVVTHRGENIRLQTVYTIHVEQTEQRKDGRDAITRVKVICEQYRLRPTYCIL